MKYSVEKIYLETLRQFVGADGLEALGGTSIDEARPVTLSETAAAFLKTLLKGKPDPSLLPGGGTLKKLYAAAADQFKSYYSIPGKQPALNTRAKIIFNSEAPVARAMAVSEIWSPELTADDDTIYESWLMKNVSENPEPYRPEEVIIQLNALYSPAGPSAPEGIPEDTAEAYNRYMNSGPEKIATYDHPVPVFTEGGEHELEKCLIELDADAAFEKEKGVFPAGGKLMVLVSISTTHRGLDDICELWLKGLINSLGLKNLQVFLLSENKARSLEKYIGNSAQIFTVQGKYACHFGALKYAQLIFEKAYGIRAGFKLDTDEGIHSSDMFDATGKTWLQQLCHPFWGGRGENSTGEPAYLGFNIGEYVDSRDLDELGYAIALRTPEVKMKEDARGPYLLFNKGLCQAKGTLLYNRGKKLEDFISHPLVKGGGYGIDNRALRQSAPVGFSMVGRAEDQQFYFSAVNRGVQGIFNPLLRIIHYKADVVKSEHKHEAGRNIADIYRMLLFRNLMLYLGVTEKTRPFPSNYASPLSYAQVFFLWLYLIFRASASGNEDEAREYLKEGEEQLGPLLDEIENGRVAEKFETERRMWIEFVKAVDAMEKEDASAWLESLVL